MDPVPLLLDNALSDGIALGYVHVGQQVQMNETRRKHNVEYYIKILCRYAHVDDDIEEEEDDTEIDIRKFNIHEMSGLNSNFRRRRNILYKAQP